MLVTGVLTRSKDPKTYGSSRGSGTLRARVWFKESRFSLGPNEKGYDRLDAGFPRRPLTGNRVNRGSGRPLEEA